jgi:glycine betaine/proline transport system ATP-binding protein
MAEALKVGDRIAIMRDGLLQQIGAPEEIVLNPANDYVRRFAEDASRLKTVSARTVATAVVTVATDAEPTETLRRAEAAGVDHVVVVNGAGAPESVLSIERLRLVAPGGGSVGESGELRPLVVEGNVVLESLLAGLRTPGSAVVVVDDQRRVVGVVDSGCVVSALAAALSDADQELANVG